jgi:hypothetical protein
MPETWVHGNKFVPRVYGPGFFGEVSAVDWTDHHGLKEGDRARFRMLSPRANYFHAPNPLTETRTLREVRVEYWARGPELTELWIHQGRDRVANDYTPTINGDPRSDAGATAVLALPSPEPVSRGISVSAAFSTYPPRAGGIIEFYGAGAVFD